MPCSLQSQRPRPLSTNERKTFQRLQKIQIIDQQSVNHWVDGVFWEQYLMPSEVEKIVVLFLQSVHDILVLIDDLLDAFDAQMLNAFRLVDQLHQLDDLLQPFRERVELAKDVVLAEMDTDKNRIVTVNRNAKGTW